MFFVPLHGGGGVPVLGHPDAELRHSPIEQSSQNLAVAVGGLGSQPSALHLAADEARDIGRRDLFKATGLDDRCLAAAVLAGLGRSLLGGCRYLSARHTDGLADGSESVAEVIDIGLGTLGRLHVADVRDVRGEHGVNGGAGRERTILSSGLGRLKLPQFLFGNLQGLGSGGDPFGLTGHHVLNVKCGIAKNETRHGGTPFGMKTRDLASPFR